MLENQDIRGWGMNEYTTLEWNAIKYKQEGNDSRNGQMDRRRIG
jgi:hypothetical protein